MAEVAEARILLLGSTGQVGWELARTLAPLGVITAPSRAELDVADLPAVRGVVRSLAPQVIVNAAAHTAVDAAEGEVAAARRLNAELPALLATEASRARAILVHYSTDYVFDGHATRPYREEDPPSPLGVYGATKLAGDEAILESGAEGYIFRVAWVYGLRGRNFLRTMLRLAGERDELRVVADQWGTPTWSRQVAEITSAALSQVLAARRGGLAAASPGVYHLAAPDATTWHGFAEAIVAESALASVPRVTAITTPEFPTPARRPVRSVLDATKLAAAFGLALPPWREQLRTCLADLSR
jgi:dTDP-4-dehydrorhamnose reductase